ncbi:PIG-L family deacetylase [bacterium]|nr:PIG-L family deacetylase [bacterium]RQV96370.1 MAG: PIG-L family deacetylase [bacterium]
MLHRACILVAHPDDETLWAGGLIIMHPDWLWKIYTLCRASDPDRAPKFLKALSMLNAKGEMADLDDGPEQEPLSGSDIQNQILTWTGQDHYDLLISHGPQGEYTRHRRHEETSRAVQTLWKEGKIDAAELWLFAYQDNEGANLPQAAAGAPIQFELPDDVWQKKYRLITEVYGFTPDSWEARTTPRVEAYWHFNRENRHQIQKTKLEDRL